MEIVASNCSFDGEQRVYSHQSAQTGTPMRIGVFLPPQAKQTAVPALVWLSGLTCTEENFVVKAGAQRIAAELGLAIIAPDTSPRGLGYPGEDDAYDFGSGAGFYVDATEAPWVNGYQMYSYVCDELLSLTAAHLPVDIAKLAISGHSMGGHGALTIAMKNPDKFRSVSAFSPIVSPINCPWGQKALTGYLGADQSAWAEYDSCKLVRERGWSGPPILIEQGLADNFLEEQLKPELFRAACAEANVALNLNLREGYDHSYFFIASFIEDHLRFHGAQLT
ncbi:MAG: S-formylglutathione hydrolase [Burkholderiaceae bacterium]